MIIVWIFLLLTAHATEKTERRVDEIEAKIDAIKMNKKELKKNFKQDFSDDLNKENIAELTNES